MCATVYGLRMLLEKWSKERSILKWTLCSSPPNILNIDYEDLRDEAPMQEGLARVGRGLTEVEEVNAPWKCYTTER